MKKTHVVTRLFQLNAPFEIADVLNIFHSRTHGQEGLAKGLLVPSEWLSSELIVVGSQSYQAVYGNRPGY